MAMTITKIETTGHIRAWTTSSVDLGDPDPNFVMSVKLFDTLTNGNGVDQANQVYADTNTITAAATNTLDLAGSLTDVYGNTITFTIIKGIIFKNTSTTASVLAVGGGSNGAGLNAWDTWITSTAADGSEQVYVRPGGCLLLYTPDATGYAVTAGTVDILAIEETSTLAGAYDIGIIGVV